MDELATKLVDSLMKVENALETMAPTAFQGLVEAAYITGFTGVAGMGLLLAVVVGCVITFFMGAHKLVENPESHCVNDGPVGMMAGSSVVGGLTLFAFFVGLTTSDTVLRILNPTAYVIKSLLNQ